MCHNVSLLTFLTRNAYKLHPLFWQTVAVFIPNCYGTFLVKCMRRYFSGLQTLRLQLLRSNVDRLFDSHQSHLVTLFITDLFQS